MYVSADTAVHNIAHLCLAPPNHFIFHLGLAPNWSIYLLLIREVKSNEKQYEKHKIVINNWTKGMSTPLYLNTYFIFADRDINLKFWGDIR